MSILNDYAGVPPERWRRITRGDGRWYMMPETLRDVYLEGPGMGSVKASADLTTLPTVQEWTAVFFPADPAAERDRIEREWVKRRDDWWYAVRNLPGGDDPLWRWSTHGDDVPDDIARDLDVRIGDESQGNANAFFPRWRLRLAYGTTSLLKFAERRGLPFPTR